MNKNLATRARRELLLEMRNLRRSLLALAGQDAIDALSEIREVIDETPDFSNLQSFSEGRLMEAAAACALSKLAQKWKVTPNTLAVILATPEDRHLA